jgi:hypothetical protein
VLKATGSLPGRRELREFPNPAAPTKDNSQNAENHCQMGVSVMHQIDIRAPALLLDSKPDAGPRGK